MWHTLESGNNIEEEEPRIPGEIYISTNPKAQTIKININIEYEDWKNEKYMQKVKKKMEKKV